MLLLFKTRNYKSFVEDACFYMTPTPKQKGLDYSVLSAKANGRNYKGLCCAVVYGANASGKTNLIGAMETLRAIVLRGNIRNSESLSMNAAAYSLELIPNCNSSNNCNNCNNSVVPTEFLIRFIDEGLLIEYSLIIDLGHFMEKDYPRNILEERLLVNGKQIFLRHKSLEIDIDIPAVIKPYINTSLKKNVMLKIAEGSLNATELFLVNGFKTIFAQELVRKIIAWFEHKLVIAYQLKDLRDLRDLRISRFASELNTSTIYVEKRLMEIAKTFGITASELAYRKVKAEDNAILLSVINDKRLPAEIFESYGTIRFITEFQMVIYAILNGATLVVDEFDASIHSTALMSIINMFHNSEINKNNAQLIFNTHNPIFLDASLLRRDEIKFVERDDISGRSEHYALSDFKTTDGIRKGEDYMKNYFVSRYGAIKNIDFSPILADIIKEAGKAGKAVEAGN